MEKAIQIQRQVRENAKTLQTYLTDLENWESEMKRKEAALTGVFEQDLPPVRSKVKKDKPVQVKKKPEKRISSSDYTAWDKFDVDKACEEVEMADVGPPSLDGKMSQQAKQEKLREEAQYEKQKGNNFVSVEKWDEAIACYNRAIELVKDDPIYYANRGLCYLKKDSLHQAESDCSEALRLDPTYVKALQRRATARERLGSLRAASNDLSEVLRLEPHNQAARVQLQAIRARMGTKGAKSKSSPSSTPTVESKPLPRAQGPKIVELSETKTEPAQPSDPTENWKNGVGENVTIIKTVKKPPHLRSKRALKPVPIHEIPLGKSTPEKPPTRLKIIEIDDSLAHGDTNNNDSNKVENIPNTMDANGDKIQNPQLFQDAPKIIPDDPKIIPDDPKIIPDDPKSTKENENSPKNILSPDSEKMVTDTLVSEKDDKVQNMVAPVNSVQFMSEWKYLKGNVAARGDYLSIIQPSKIPSIFENALESDVLSEVLTVLASNPNKFVGKSVAAYLKGLSNVKRFSALAMFLSNNDKQSLTKLLNHCKTVENCTEDEIADLKNKYEL